MTNEPIMKRNVPVPQLKVPKRLKVLRIIGTILLGMTAIILFMIALPSQKRTPEMIFEEAKATCSSEIWLIENDAVFYDILPVVSPPYPESLRGISREQVVSFACSKEEAEQKRESLSNRESTFLLIALGVYAAVMTVPSILIWWLVEEIVFWKKRSAKAE
jgi:hypothetical protein